MSIRTKKAANKIAVTFLSVSTALFLSGASLTVPLVANAALTESQIQSILSLLSSFGADQSTINNVNASLRGQPTTPVPPSSSTGNCGFTRSLSMGMTGNDVKCLQQYLNSVGFQVSASGAGAPGMETTYFGAKTKAAVVKWQAANGVSPTSGLFGPISRAKYNSMVGQAPAPTPVPPGTPTPPGPVGTQLRIDPGIQPANSLAPQNAARVPFTQVRLTAGVDGDVTVNSITIERTGLAADTSFDGIVLLDENMVQLGISKTLNSSHQASIGEPIVVKAGQSRTVTVAANMDSDLAGEAGQVAMFSVLGVNTSATVSGVLPITGAAHTINSTLTIGSVTVARGALDPGSSQTKEVGTLGYTFSSVKVTAGSAEKVYLTHIRWNQTGSTGSGDIANLKTYVDGTAYDTMASADGKYYTAKFPGKGILVDKGFSADISIKGDIVGGSARTIDFDIAKQTDIGLMGETYGYGLIPPLAGSDPTDDSSNFSSVEDPYYDASQVTVSTGTMNVSVATAVSAQNIAINVLGQPLGALSVDVKGEAISVQSMIFNVSLVGEGANDDVDDITNAQLVDQNGAVLSTADGSATDTSGNEGKITFAETITFQPGVTTLTLKAKIGSDIDGDVTIAASTTPSGWSTVRGLTTGNTVTPAPSSALNMPRMTVKAGALTISAQTVPTAQTVIAGSSQFEFARYNFDATGSGEDIRIPTIPLAYGVATGNANDLTNCKLYDGATVVNSSNIINPTSESSSTSFTFDGSGLTLAKGMSKIISLKCDLRSGSTGSYLWGLDSGEQTGYTGAQGLTSGSTIAETLSDSNGQAMTAAAGGSVTAALDSNSPTYKAVSSLMTNVELARIRFNATNEAVDLRQVALQLTGAGSTTASSTPNDLVGRVVTLWTTEGVQIGTANFSTQEDYATSSAIASGAFRIPKDGNKVLVVKGDISNICTSCDITTSGDFLKVDYDGNNTGINGNYGVGVASGANVTPTGGDTSTEGIRIFKAYPTFAAVTGWQPASLVNGDQPLFRFSVKANGGDVGVHKFTMRLATTSVQLTGVNMFAYTDSAFSSPVSNVNTGAGQMASGTVPTLVAGWADSSTDIEIFVNNSSGAARVLNIPSGSTYYFEVRGTVASADASGDAVSVQLQGDASSYSDSSNQMSSVDEVTAYVDDDFIWTPNSLSAPSVVTDVDFTNGYLLPGLPTSNMNAQVLSR